jgi:hypothetical protein
MVDRTKEVLMSWHICFPISHPRKKFAALMLALAAAFASVSAAVVAGALNWLAGQYTGVATDDATDAVVYAVRSALIRQKKPQSEIWQRVRLNPSRG